MSIEAISWVLNDAPVDDQGQLLILLGLANHATREGERAYPSVATLAEYGRCSTRTVHRHLKSLEDGGVIVRGDQDWIPGKIPANRRPVVYDLRINLRRGVTVVTPHDLSGVTDSTVRGDSGGSSGVTLLADKPSFEPTTNQLQRDDDAELTLIDAGPPALPSAADRDFMDWWAAYPRKIGKPAAVKAYKAALKKTTADVMLRAVKGTSWPKDVQYVPHPTTWLNQERWTDETPQTPVQDAAARRRAQGGIAW